MVNTHDPAVVAQDYLVLGKLWHAVAGLYFWEFVTTLDYEWSVLRRHRPFRWTIWIYFVTRIATLLAIVLFLVDINVTAGINCKVVTIFELELMGTASLAIWNMKKIVIAIATSVWGTGVIFQIQTIVRIRVGSIAGEATCTVSNPHITNLDALTSFTTDIILLFIMFFGLIRLHSHRSSAFGMGRFLWRQGLVWLLVAFIADILPMVLVFLNINDPIDDLFLAPWVVALSIAATRIHRGLVDFASVGRTEQLPDPSYVKANGRAESKANRVTRTQLSRGMEVAIPEMYEQDETPQMSQQSAAGSLIDVEGQLYEKPTGPDENVENGVGSPTD